ncbi:hypothetical protein GCM10025875_34680 [Litorihabitans aurantiacus]|uniref:SLH domain-containing protein n=1 Tax=Litorihabitans aurantiacus TaxID=1930061 RepID=A0AA38CUL3_9MICO|nr:hypothetical protein GCM10025875_00220 [Litorihabitans aurantiacus]GMA33476.1 hypothetical protein GCM10025875_34680 [Litorihabitans aurantiacus]
MVSFGDDSGHLTIAAEGATERTPSYIASVALDGEDHSATWVDVEDLRAAGDLTFDLVQDRTTTSWGKAEADRLPSVAWPDRVAPELTTVEVAATAGVASPVTLGSLALTDDRPDAPGDVPVDELLARDVPVSASLEIDGATVPVEATATDDGTAWELAAVLDLPETGTVTGTLTVAPAGERPRFAPEPFAPVTAEVTVQVRQVPLEFVDVAPDQQFAADIAWLAERGITTGWENPDGTREFRPLTPIARDAMAAFLYRLAGRPEVALPPASPFTDVTPENQFYTEIVWLSQAGISTGWGSGDGTAEFRPLEPIGRDAMAAFLYRMAQEPDTTPPAVSPFTDVTPQTQFYREITWLHGTEIATGWVGNDGTALYRPTSPINRDAMAAFLHRFDEREQR